MRLMTVAAILLASVTAFADDAPLEEWVRHWEPEDGSAATGGVIAVDANGNVYVATTASDLTGVQDIALLKYDASGALAWSLIYDGAGGGNDAATELALTDEGISVVGTSIGRDGPGTILLDLDVDGNVRWERSTIGPSFAGFLQPQVAIGADGRRVIATDDNAGTGVIEAYDAEGTMLFEKTITMVGFSGVSALEIDDELRTTLVTVENVGGGMVYKVRRLDEAGDELWSKIQAQNTGLVLSDAFVVTGSDGEVVVAGSPEVPCVTVKSRVWRHAADGTILWQHDLPAGDCDFSVVTGMAAGPDGEVYLVGSANPASMLARIEPDGTIAWIETFGGDGIITGFRDIAVTPEGRVIVVGTEAPADDVTAFDVRVLCYDTKGTLGWTTLFAGPGGEADLLGSLAAGADESAAVVATVNYPRGFPNIVTLRYGFATCSGDIDGDGAVDGEDLGLLLGAWGPDSNGAADLDGDGAVDGADLGLLLGDWGTCS